MSTAITKPTRRTPSKRAVLGERAAARVFTDIESEIGRDELLEALDDYAESDDRCRVMFDLLTSPIPTQANLTIKTAARKAGLTPIDVIDLIRKRNLHIGLLRTSRHVAQVMEDTAIDAKSTDEQCIECAGEGQVTKGTGDKLVVNVCKPCRGMGVIRRLGDIENRKLIWDITGLVKRGAGVVINNANVQPGSAESFESVIARAGKAIDAAAEPTPMLPSGGAE